MIQAHGQAKDDNGKQMSTWIDGIERRGLQTREKVKGRERVGVLEWRGERLVEFEWHFCGGREWVSRSDLL